MRKPKLFKLRGDNYEFPWELSYTPPDRSFKEWKRFATWDAAIKYMIYKAIPSRI